jgi:hypothetical protein
MMRSALVVLATSIALLWVYSNILVWAIGHAMALPQPSQWGGLFPTRLSATLSWMQLIHTAAILAISVPFAFLISHFYGRRGVWVALGITAVLFALFSLPSLVRFSATLSPRVQIITAFDNLKLLLVLPLLVLLMNRLTSSYRWRGR